jgi:large subunit ribosomal protein L18
MKKNSKKEAKKIRHLRIRKRISGTDDKPRLCVFKSLNHIYAQLINDEHGFVVVSANDLEVKNMKLEEKKDLKGKILKAYQVGKLIAKKALDKKIKKVVFDRAGYKYHGRVKALAEGAREGGLSF